MSQRFMLGDEAIAMGALHAGITAAYGYPGTPSTEILEALIGHYEKHKKPLASWSVNEKTALEQALGVSLAGKRSLVTMKHVGLNVAADPFMNAALINIKGGLVIVVADDPGMHSSQNEQDTRYYADFAHVMCLEPSDQQEAYDMTREAFELSEKHHIPVLLRVVTRLAHSRAAVKTDEHASKTAAAFTSAAPVPIDPQDTSAWVLVPGNARRQWHSLVQRYPQFRAYAEQTRFNPLEKGDRRLGVITTGVAKNYYLENLGRLGYKPTHLHIGAYPFPKEKIRELCGSVDRVLVLEEGYPHVERYLRGILDTPVKIDGKLNGVVQLEGELTPDLVGRSLGLEPRKSAVEAQKGLAGRPPQLCQGCPHGDTYTALKTALAEVKSKNKVVTSDIGCYTLGALPPYSAVESCVCMGASVGMAKGASDAGLKPAVAVIGDSTFYHSGITPLIDAIAANTDMTLLIVDNEATAMTGGQTTILPSHRMKGLLLGLGVNPEHLHFIEAHRKYAEQNVAIIKRELEYQGLSVIVAVRECLETAKRKKRSGA